jgi:hypothetical protein
MTPCSPLRVNRRFGGTYRLHLFLLPAFTLVSCSAYSSTLKMEAISSPETSVDIRQTTRRYIPEDSTLQLKVQVLTAVVMKSTIFWDITPSSPLKVNRFGRTYCLHLQGWRNNFSKNQQVSRWQAESAYLLVLAEIISSTPKMEAICSSESSVATQQTTRRHIPEDDTFHNHRCESLKSYKDKFTSTFVISKIVELLNC